ncbi:hypothetical protein WA026_012037 [Henosepilachna vigintioctopunctata]|uniref:Uncharacterized protein n=1 Tax=Henosepilachna vigintioctopunctata TaxID=420089 RepID=A0AAW1VE11_9CUCU
MRAETSTVGFRNLVEKQVKPEKTRHGRSGGWSNSPVGRPSARERRSNFAREIPIAEMIIWTTPAEEWNNLCANRTEYFRNFQLRSPQFPAKTLQRRGNDIREAGGGANIWNDTKCVESIYDLWKNMIIRERSILKQVTIFNM